MTVLLGYIPCPNEDSAAMIAKDLLDRKWIACANILPPMRSLYIWDDRLEEQHEHLLLIKTLAQHVDAILEVVPQIHPYACPCILFFPAATVSPAFAAWVGEHVGERVDGHVEP